VMMWFGFRPKDWEFCGRVRESIWSASNLCHVRMLYLEAGAKSRPAQEGGRASSTTNSSEQGALHTPQAGSGLKGGVAKGPACVWVCECVCVRGCVEAAKRRAGFFVLGARWINRLNDSTRAPQRRAQHSRQARCFD